MLEVSGDVDLFGGDDRLMLWWPGTESNRRRQPFQGCALPTELPGHFGWVTYIRASSVGPLKIMCVRNVFDYNNLAEFTQTEAMLRSVYGPILRRLLCSE